MASFGKTLPGVVSAIESTLAKELHFPPAPLRKRRYSNPTLLIPSHLRKMPLTQRQLLQRLSQMQRAITRNLLNSRVSTSTGPEENGFIPLGERAAHSQRQHKATILDNPNTSGIGLRFIMSAQPHPLTERMTSKDFSRASTHPMRPNFAQFKDKTSLTSQVTEQ